MTAKEMKIKVFSLIEEYYPDSTLLAEDEDVKYKVNGVINQIQMDLMPYRKIDAVETITIGEEDSKIIDLKENLEGLYQINNIDLDEDWEMPNGSTLVLPDDYVGTFKIYYYKYPTLMELVFVNDAAAAAYDAEFTFDLDEDVLEVAPYGIAADLLKMDMISKYGTYFKMEYDARKQQIDSRRTKGIIRIEKGIDL